ncbi:hypothetical protein TrRE_jg4728 [Triparma retinervis]|uniref:Uncharacterized protein n=1 Tax=Triparma retinervis TaxID=2557542 RepID=A0A9W6ZRJ8_9STRA|nr:hypothetical protein TrRE_jg4728 [Triparma retinervis]
MSDSDSDDASSQSSAFSEKSAMAEIEKFSEGEEALALAAAEEERLKKEANDRIAALGVRDPMLDDAIEIWGNVEEEKHNDHGKPWKKPPPERRKNRPKLRAPLPEKYSRYGKSRPPQANFSVPKYHVSSSNDPRMLPSKGKTPSEKALGDLKEMMATLTGGEDQGDENEDAFSIKHSASNRHALAKTPAFSTGTRNDWAKVNSLDLQPTVRTSSDTPGTHYDLERAEKKTMLKRNPAAEIIGRPQENYEARTRDTPGPIYNGRLSALSTKPPGRTVEFSPNPRFKDTKKDRALVKPPGPGSYNVEKSEVKLCNTLPFDGLKQYSNPMKAAAPDLRAMRNYGHGCSYSEHVLYGQCLDGKCSTRAPWEKFNMKKIKHWRARPGVEIKGEEFKDKEKTAVHFAVMYADLKLVDKLLKENGLDVDAADQSGQTPLHIACEKGLSRITERLLNNEQHPLKIKIGFVSKR